MIKVGRIKLSNSIPERTDQPARLEGGSAAGCSRELAKRTKS